jgi:PleD family two-component response regulator
VPELTFDMVLSYNASMAKKENNKKILLCDYKASRREMLASRFRLQSFEVDQSNSGFHILAMLEKTPYSSILIFSDLYDMSAHELIGLIRNLHSKEELQIIFSDSNTSQKGVLELFKLGVSDYIKYSEKIFGSLLDKVSAFNAPPLDTKKSILTAPEEEAKASE